MATVFSLYVIVLGVLRGSFYFDVYETGAGRIIMSYYAAGVGGGILVGALRPLTRWPIGSVCVGGLAGVFVYFAVALSLGQTPGDAVLVAMLAGPFVGGLAGFELTDRRPSNRHDVGDEEWTDRHSIVVDRTTGPRVRRIQIVGLCAMVLGATTCTVGAASDAATSTGIGVFLVGALATLMSQLWIWARRIAAQLRRPASR